jgi:hypothetical protein
LDRDFRFLSSTDKGRRLEIPELSFKFKSAGDDSRIIGNTEVSRLPGEVTVDRFPIIRLEPNMTEPDVLFALSHFSEPGTGAINILIPKLMPIRKRLGFTTA